MGVRTRFPDMRDAFERAKRDREALADALATIEQCNMRLAAGRIAWFWPTIAHW